MSRYCKIRCNACNEELASLELPDGEIQCISDGIRIRNGLASDIELIIPYCENDHNCEDCIHVQNADAEGYIEGEKEGAKNGFIRGLYRALTFIKDAFVHKDEAIGSLINALDIEIGRISKSFSSDKPEAFCEECFDYEDGVKEGRILGMTEGHLSGYIAATSHLMGILMRLSAVHGDTISISEAIDTFGKKRVFEEDFWKIFRTQHEAIETLSDIHKNHSKDPKVLMAAPVDDFNVKHVNFDKIPNLQSVLINLEPKIAQLREDMTVGVGEL